MKTLQGWNDRTESPNYFGDYATKGDEIDSELYDYFLNIMPIIEHSSGVFQVDEPYSEVDRHFTYGTYQQIEDNFYYHGNITKKEAGKI